jgi:hypothetical protein
MGLRPPKVMKNCSRSATTLPESHPFPLVIPTGADPDFLLRAVATNKYAVFLKETA